LSGGSGTQSDPFQIRTERQLAELNDCGTDGYYLYYELENDITLVSDDSKYWNDSDYGWDPIGYSSSGDGFTGNFNGNGHTISGLRIAQGLAWDDNQGLFGTTYNAVIKNVTVEGEIESYGYDNIGGLVGYADWGTTVSGVHTDVTITDSNGDSDDVGGIVGYGYGTTIANSSSAGKVSSIYDGDDHGGLLGYGYYFSVYNSSSSSEVEEVDAASPSNTTVGGLVGYGDYGNIANSTFSGSVTGDYYVGGALGYGDYVSVSGTTVTSDALVQAESEQDVWEIGGIAGYISAGAVNDSTFAGELDGNQHNNEIGEIGGLVGYAYESSVAGSTVASTAVLDIAGDGSDSYYVGGAVGDGDYATIHDVTVNADLNVYNAEYIGGIVGYVEDGTSVIGSVNTGDVNATSDSSAYEYAGGIAGYIQDGATIGASANKGDVSFNGDTYTYYVGGLVGYAENATSINDSYNLGSVEGNEDVAGLVGWAQRGMDINTSYNAGAVNAYDDYQDGIANGDWADSSSNVVLDTDVSAGSDTNVNQLSTADVQDASVLAGLGWSIGSADSTWAQDADFNNGYPYLSYEYTAASAGVQDVVFAPVKFKATKHSASLSLNAQAYLTLVASEIKAGHSAKIEIDSYTNRKTRGSVARAATAAVKAFLRAEGVTSAVVVHNNITNPGHHKNTVVITALG
jgi:hypothetical protein